MFTGIVESLGKVKKITPEGNNIHFEIVSELTNELYIDQSIAHNGVCLTVVEIYTESYVVTAVKETLIRTNLGYLKPGEIINLERSMLSNSRIDGHFVQGHVDTMATCISIKDEAGSWFFEFRINPEHKNLLVDKGSVCINGISLTVVNPANDVFGVAIIPYTFQHTNFSSLKPTDKVNIEFDILGKYIVKYLEGIKLS